MNPVSVSCRHPDVRKFDGVRCCLACGLALFESLPSDRHLDSTEAAPTNANQYSYKPLNYILGQEIRLLSLDSGSLADAVTCHIIHVNLLDKPAFEALSYTWATQSGDASLSQIIYCDQRPIMITRNCEAALRRLRKRAGRRLLWVDAICINQNNEEEKNHQVGLMDVIYSSASQVLIYLGICSPSIDRVFDYDKVFDYLSGATVTVPYDHDMRELLRRRWFERVWVLQEMSLARLAMMIFGTKIIRWDAQSIEKTRQFCVRLGHNLPAVLNWQPGSRPDGDLFSHLQKSRNSSSTDPRDKVFALLSLAGPESRKWILPDYSQTVGEVFTQVATQIVLHHKTLDILLHTTPDAQRTDVCTVSSWAPRWEPHISIHPSVPQF
ncbi:heterokaryon incompatibility protein-domain-containing protein, partial [Massariosphaeria phaeospora]